MEQNQKPLFVIDTNPAVTWPVVVKLPADGGAFVEYQFDAKFRVLSAAEFAALSVESVSNGTTEVTMIEILKDNSYQFAKLVIGWDEVADTSGTPVPFTADALAAQVTGPHGAELSAGLWNAVREIRSGVRLGNSVPLPVAG